MTQVVAFPAANTAGRGGRSLRRKRLHSSPSVLVTESRPADDRASIDLVPEVRCECGRPDCMDTVPAVAEKHRGIAERLVVTPAHLEGGVVVRAADRFFVVEPRRHALVDCQRVVR